MYSHLPPLNSLRAFEAAARLLSFTIASKELFVTHGAISKQVRILEEYVGTPLFIRQHRSLKLTDEGERYFVNVQSALQTINNATADLIDHPLRTQTLAINVLPSLTISWLIPRMEDFKSRFPHLYVDLSIGDFDVDFSSAKYDIAVRSATSIPKGVNVMKLMDEDLCLVCSPELSQQLTSLESINQMTLLKHTTRPDLWQLWAEDVGIKLTTKNKFGVEHFYMLSQAAVSGMGVALIPRFFIEDELKSGTLVIPFVAKFTSPYSYYLLTPKSSNLSLKVQAFIDWLLELFSPYRET
ncbi:LysR family transcriptional regulator [Shewanella sp. Choline-02u-19]|jgi:LysR family glycine cleavage system transcriptional activator|uniref:transcriptional regulator GcvA n=1 Tax=unclassified Shewanella TaxID=196818 RepID=UPI000C33716B|nr:MULTISPECIES: transcriptional regulator GcvA [unclassified Shewanella]PKG57571.1 LysR family transcriptional regulator [Shewanella sp. GutDb-MelDb]PKG73470.1 LysR family transcriptional regulator [Shewanella sp. GutCb]PKH53649.1 LysR family transcriptional regulator [Shewanella sp. Bg11-22]PKI28077.1 LysR family transcriptional regulator [Shewanella sp. Choline-02u-19]